MKTEDITQILLNASKKYEITYTVKQNKIIYVAVKSLYSGNMLFNVRKAKKGYCYSSTFVNDVKFDFHQLGSFLSFMFYAMQQHGIKTHLSQGNRIKWIYVNVWRYNITRKWSE